MKNRIDRVTRAELKPVVAFQLLSFNSLAIDEGTVLAAQVLNEKAAIFRDEEGMVTRDPRVGDNQVFVHLAADAERRVVESQHPLLADMDEDQAGKNT